LQHNHSIFLHPVWWKMISFCSDWKCSEIFCLLFNWQQYIWVWSWCLNVNVSAKSLQLMTLMSL
jgi:hypothetical protein